MILLRPLGVAGISTTLVGNDKAFAAALHRRLLSDSFDSKGRLVASGKKPRRPPLAQPSGLPRTAQIATLKLGKPGFIREIPAKACSGNYRRQHKKRRWNLLNRIGRT